MKRVVVLLCCVACEAPPVFPTADKRQNDPSGRIEGDVVVTGPARGDAIVLLYDAAKPPPPAGTGRPLTFATVGREALFPGGAAGNGPFTAPFAFSLVKPGSYLVRGLIDANHDFIPFYGVTADANAGDVGGAAVDPFTGVPRVISVEHVTLDVSVSFSSAVSTVPVDRPAFQVVSPDLAATVAEGMPPVVLELRPQPVDEGVVHQKQPVFLAQLIDDDHDGLPDDKNRDGAPDMWPRVIVRKLAQNSLLADDTGDYDHVIGTALESADGVPDVVVLAAGFDPTDNLAQLIDPMTGAPRPTPVPVTKLKLVIKPIAVDGANPLAPVPLYKVPSGSYAIILIAPTGQTWRVPNELAPVIAVNVGLPSITSQAFVVQVP